MIVRDRNVNRLRSRSDRRIIRDRSENPIRRLCPRDYGAAPLEQLHPGHFIDFPVLLALTYHLITEPEGVASPVATATTSPVSR